MACFYLTSRDYENGTAQVGAPLKVQKSKVSEKAIDTFFSKVYRIYSAEKYQKDTHKIRTPLEISKLIFLKKNFR